MRRPTDSSRSRSTFRSAGLAVSLVCFCCWGCPAAHDPYETGLSCLDNDDCTYNEICTHPDAGLDGGDPALNCYVRTSLRACNYPEAGVFYYCFNSNARCEYRTTTCIRRAPDGGCLEESDDEQYGCRYPPVEDAGTGGQQ